jgi:hypothetical protein
MPKAFSISYGLDWDTEVSSFWAWFQDARDIMEGRVEPHSLVQELVNSQRDKIDDLANRERDPRAAQLALTAAIALVGFHYASMQKLLDGLDSAGVFRPPRELPAFDTVVQPVPED